MPGGLAGNATATWTRGAEHLLVEDMLGTPAGVAATLDSMRGGEKRAVEVKSMNRLDHLRLKSTF
jgi:hypothetical protein